MQPSIEPWQPENQPDPPSSATDSGPLTPPGPSLYQQLPPTMAMQPIISPTDPNAPQQATVIAPEVGNRLQAVDDSQYLQYSQSAGSIENKARSNHRWPLFWASAIAVLILLASGGAFAYFKLHVLTPDEAFKAALTNALSSKNVTQKADAKSTGYTVAATIKYDLANVKDPRIDTDVSLSSNQASINFEGYGTLQNTYIKLKNTPGEKLMPAGLTDVWIQVRKDGATPDAATTSNTMATMYDPYFAVLGQYIFGNFSGKDRAELVDLAMNQHLYDYQAKNVTTAKVGGMDVYVYKVSMAGDKLKAFNKKAAEIIGLKGADLDATLSMLSDMKATMYVSVHNSQLVKVVTENNETTVYSDWNRTSLPNEPKPVMQYNEFLQKSSQTSAQSLNNSADSRTPVPNSTSPKVGSTASALDSEREESITSLDSHLEAYYAENGNYPTLAQMNDITWVKADLVGLDPAALLDPSSTSFTGFASQPTKGQYSYQVGSDKNFTDCSQDISACYYFRVTAVLSDGTVFAKVSNTGF